MPADFVLHDLKEQGGLVPVHFREFVKLNDVSHYADINAELEKNKHEIRCCCCSQAGRLRDATSL